MGQFSLFPPPSLTVSDLTRYLRQLFESDEILQDVWVQGEISNLSRPSSGHIYFSLKDEQATLRCVIWRSSAARLRAALQNGLAVEAHGAVSIYERDGQYQLYIDALRPAGEGQLFQEFLRLKDRLEAEGLFDEGRKQPIPAWPRRIGIVTSPTAAALQDILNTLRRRYPLAEVILAPAAVQGKEAPAEIAAALQMLARRARPDVILLGRGGGSLEDLWAFNDELVVRAIAACEIPIISGIGHETDFTLADFAADLRAPTPTAAAVAATPDAADLRAALSAAHLRLSVTFQSLLGQRQELLAGLHSSLQRASPLWRIQNDRQRLDEQLERARRALAQGVRLRRAHWQGFASRLLSLNPLTVLQRGYAVVSRTDGEVVRSVAQVYPGLDLRVRLADGQFEAQAGGSAPD